MTAAGYFLPTNSDFMTDRLDVTAARQTDKNPAAAPGRSAEEERVCRLLLLCQSCKYRKLLRIRLAAAANRRSYHLLNCRLSAIFFGPSQLCILGTDQ